jgi:multicomponent Na+:H+ antiporter subunit A
LDVPLDFALAFCAIAPFIAAVLMPIVHRAFPGISGWIAAIVPAVTFAFLWRYLEPVSSGGAIRGELGWAPLHDISLSFVLDGLSLTFALLIAGIGAVILVYSGRYLRGHPRQGRFLSFMLMFMGAMQGLVLADNLVGLYVFWELTSVTSFLLIGFDSARQAARRAAIQALVVTGIGGLALLAGAILLQRLGGSWEISGLMAAGPDLTAHPAYPVVLVLVLLAAFTKSAQFPFHFWLPNAMEAPTPVSAYLHSATMVQAGVYLLARFSPLLGGTELWTSILVTVGAVTLLWGALAALRQTDLKLMLAQTTVASLGLLVLLLGIGTELAVTAATLYFVAHALYKAALFLIAGAIDHATGTRDITALGGLRDPMTVTFIATILAAISMIGLPPLLGYFAKEEMYAALVAGAWQPLVILAVLVLGNALLCGVALAVMIRPYMGQYVPPPKDAHEAPVTMIGGPILFGLVGVFAGFAPDWFGSSFIASSASVIAGEQLESHMAVGLDLTSILFWLSVLTWLLGALVYWRLDLLRTQLRRFEAAIGWTFDKGFDAVMFGLIRFAGAVTRSLHHGRLELYLVVVFIMLALALLVPLWTMGGLPTVPEFPDLKFYEWGVVGIALIGVVTVVLARTRLFAILALGIQGLAVALIYMLFGAPDLSFTQFMVEVLSVVILALVMTRLNLQDADARPLEDLLRDGGLALCCGAGVTLLLFAVLQGVFDPRLSDFFNANSTVLAHGRNVVNVILVDFRGLDTLGEISVVMTAGIAILALIRGAKRSKPPEPVEVPVAPKQRRRKAA